MNTKRARVVLAGVAGGAMLSVGLLAGGGAATAATTPTGNGGYIYGPYSSPGQCNAAHKVVERDYTLELRNCARTSSGWTFYARFGA